MIGNPSGKDTWVVDQAWGRDGWVLTKFSFLRVYGPGWRAINTQKSERGQYPAILFEQGWSTRDSRMRKILFSCGTQRVIPSGQDNSTLSPQVANHSAGFASSCFFHLASFCFSNLFNASAKLFGTFSFAQSRKISDLNSQNFPPVNIDRGENFVMMTSIERLPSNRS